MVTADTGEDSMLVVWDSLSATPVRTFLNPHTNGVKCMDLSSDCQYIVTIGAEDELGKNMMQTISLWDWLNEAAEGPIISMMCKSGIVNDLHWVKFNPENNHEIAINGKERVAFLSWKERDEKTTDGRREVEPFQYYGTKIDKRDFSSNPKKENSLTKTVFLPGTMAVTGTSKGDIIVWDESLIIEGVGEQNEKRQIKVVTLMQDHTEDISCIM